MFLCMHCWGLTNAAVFTTVREVVFFLQEGRCFVSLFLEAEEKFLFFVNVLCSQEEGKQHSPPKLAVGILTFLDQGKEFTPWKVNEVHTVIIAIACVETSY